MIGIDQETIEMTENLFMDHTTKEIIILIINKKMTIKNTMIKNQVSMIMKIIEIRTQEMDILIDKV